MTAHTSRPCLSLRRLPLALVAGLAALLPLSASAVADFSDGQLDAHRLGSVGAPSVNFADFADGQVFFNLTALGEYNSNITLNSSELSDWEWQLTPELEYLHKKGVLTLEFDAGVLVDLFNKDTHDDAENPYTKLSLNWAEDGGKSSLDLTASARRDTEPNQFINTIATSDDYNLSAAFAHHLTEKFGYRVHADFNGSAYNASTGFDSTYTPSVGLDAFYQYSPKLESFLNYTYRWTNLSYAAAGQTDVNSRDQRLAVGLKGDLLTKLTGNVTVGFVQRRFDVGGDEHGALFADTSVDWNYLEKCNVTVFANHDFSTSPGDQSVTAFTTGLEFTEDVTEKITLGQRLAYGNSIFAGGTDIVTARSDNTDTLNLRASYKFTDLISSNLFFTYQKARSTEAASSFNQTVIGMSVTAKF